MITDVLDNELIDKLVAIRVMGWHLGDYPGVYGQWLNPKNVQCGLELDWHPSRMIDDAWQVLEHFTWPHYYTRLVRTETGKWRCDIELCGGDGPVVSAVNEQAPLAICLAAIQATQPREGAL